MALTFYANESEYVGSVLTLAGVACSPTGERHIRADWAAMLAKHGIDEFHASDIVNRRGTVYSAWSLEERNALMRDAVGVIVRQGTKGLLYTAACSVVFNGRWPRKFNYRLWELAFVSMFAQTSALTASASAIEFVFDEKEKVAGVVGRFFDQAREHSHEWLSATGPTFASGIDRPVLQVSDLFAWSIRRAAHCRVQDQTNDYEFVTDALVALPKGLRKWKSYDYVVVAEIYRRWKAGEDLVTLWLDAECPEY